MSHLLLHQGIDCCANQLELCNAVRIALQPFALVEGNGNQSFPHQNITTALECLWDVERNDSLLRRINSAIRRKRVQTDHLSPSNTYKEIRHQRRVNLAQLSILWMKMHTLTGFWLESSSTSEINQHPDNLGQQFVHHYFRLSSTDYHLNCTRPFLTRLLETEDSIELYLNAAQDLRRLSNTVQSSHFKLTSSLKDNDQDWWNCLKSIQKSLGLNQSSDMSWKEITRSCLDQLTKQTFNWLIGAEKASNELLLSTMNLRTYLIKDPVMIPEGETGTNCTSLKIHRQLDSSNLSDGILDQSEPSVDELASSVALEEASHPPDVPLGQSSTPMIVAKPMSLHLEQEPFKHTNNNLCTNDRTLIDLPLGQSSHSGLGRETEAIERPLDHPASCVDSSKSTTVSHTPGFLVAHDVQPSDTPLYTSRIVKKIISVLDPIVQVLGKHGDTNVQISEKNGTTGPTTPSPSKLDRQPSRMPSQTAIDSSRSPLQSNNHPSISQSIPSLQESDVASSEAEVNLCSSEVKKLHVDLNQPAPGVENKNGDQNHIVGTERPEETIFSHPLQHDHTPLLDSNAKFSNEGSESAVLATLDSSTHRSISLPAQGGQDLSASMNLVVETEINPHSSSQHFGSLQQSRVDISSGHIDSSHALTSINSTNIGPCTPLSPTFELDTEPVSFVSFFFSSVLS
ncbi:hypothetical protein CROQUDRAFT_647933 [Cronartium quercuum f. sp. fusiforme G11]|uniref:Uncharacterized protein n=1 Tax=Cronartium quercuum f. sp. fusiforme G11 TaxID=708437 RepID=A0A9P6NGY4_9BASI|nr:hypothetical protein CROQUDRAFT_647933 [Cronartium quercuum f. sp. fusiforme G11]